LSSIVLFGFNMNMNYCITISSNALRFFADAVPAGKPMGNRATAFTIFLFYLFDVLVVYLVPCGVSASRSPFGFLVAEFPQAVLRLDSSLRSFRKPFPALILICAASASHSPFGFSLAEFPQAVSSSDSHLRRQRKPFPALILICAASASHFQF